MKSKDFLAMIALRAESLTKRQIEVLRILRDDDEELVYERGRGYIGLSPVSGRTLFALLECCAISPAQGSEVGRFERYTINETGLRLLTRIEEAR